MENRPPTPSETVAEAELVERLQWLLRLRWLIVPVFVAVDLASDLLLNRPAPWVALAIGGFLLAANGAYSLLLSSRRPVRTLLLWARFESVVVVALPIVAVLLHHDPNNPLRYGVLVGVVGAAAVLPRTTEVAVVGMWAVASLIVGDAIAVDFEGSRITHALVARWAMESGLITTIAILAGYLHSTREWSQQRLRSTVSLMENVKAEWEATFDNLHELVVVTDLDGRVLRINSSFAKILGGKPHQLAGRTLSELLSGHPDRWWSGQADSIVELEDPLFDTLFEITLTRLGDRIVRVARDVGEQRRLYARLVQADKMASIGVLASGVAHEINNPTAFVSSNLTELKRYIGTYEGAFAELAAVAMEAGHAVRASALLQRADLALARREASLAIQESLQGMERIGQIVANLRVLARRDQAGEPAQPVPLAEIVQAVVRTAASDLRGACARIDITEPCWVLGHRGELVDVVLNLVVNAIQARDETRPNQISIELLREGTHAVVRVSDTGKGIAPKYMKRLFEPFFTTKAPGEGTGLGLSLTRNIILAHGGSIDVASQPGVGSTFTVRLPALDPEAVQASAQLRATRAGSG
jgi:PAS domain S-box-containing protein